MQEEKANMQLEYVLIPTYLQCVKISCSFQSGESCERNQLTTRGTVEEILPYWGSELSFVSAVATSALVGETSGILFIPTTMTTLFKNPLRQGKNVQRQVLAHVNCLSHSVYLIFFSAFSMVSTHWWALAYNTNIFTLHDHSSTWIGPSTCFFHNF